MEENSSSILVVDDNPEIREIIQVLLGGEGYLVETAGNGVKALEMLENREYDLIILDIMMPGMDGYQTCRKMREESNAPILFLSARTKDSDKTLGFSSGGDDYLAKPFSYNELISRAKALIRRYQVYKGKAEKVETPKNFSCKNLVVAEETKSVYSDGQLLELTDTEYAILLLLLKNRRQVFSTERLYEAVWKENFYYGAENTVMVHIRNLRRKVERDSKNPMIIKTSWGKGYYEYVQQVPGFRDMSQDEDFWEKLRTEAANYNIPSSEDDKEGIKKIQPFLSQGDKYTGIYIYNLKEGTYVAGKFPSVLNNAAFSTFFDMGYQLTGGEGEETYEFPMKFKNGYATVMVWFYHRVRFIYPYCIFCLTVSIGLFFGVILFFIKKKMNMVASLKDEILRMAAGNLRDNVPEMGQDEIGIIAEELDNLRTALQDTLVREKESRRANQDLITAMSHDLRTPLTILNGYLEVLRLNRNPEMHEEYLNRCLQKTSDIREMTDRMFEYALVFEEVDDPKVKEIPIEYFRDCINEHSDFIKLAGFQPELDYTNVERWITGDKGMIKRIFSNLFSNILKYGDKSVPVNIKGCFTKTTYILTMSNGIKQQSTGVESNHIGLMSVEKMMQQLGGKSSFSEENGLFSVRLEFHLTAYGRVDRPETYAGNNAGSI